MNTLFDIWNNIQSNLFPWLEEELDPLSEKEQQFIEVVSLLDLGKHMKEYGGCGIGRKRKSRISLAKAFIAKAVYNLCELPTRCDVGTKKNSKGYKISWKGYKLHIDCIDGDIPVNAISSSASLHDSQVAIPLSQMTSARVNSLYDLMDSAYDAPQIKDFSRKFGHVLIIDDNPRRNGEKIQMDLATKTRFNQRTSVERVNSYLQDNYGGNNIRVKGSKKVMTHLMFGVVVITAMQL